MPAADYVVLSDGEFVLEAGSHQTDNRSFTARIPTAPSVFEPQFSPMLMLYVEPLTSQTLKFMATLNNTSGDHHNETNKILEYLIQDDVRLPRSIHEPFSVGFVIPGGNNVFTFSASIGKVRISKVVVFFHVRSF